MSLGKALLIINPAARHGETAALRAPIEQVLANVAHDTVLTEGMGHATTLAAQAGAYDTVIAMGGDGTVHEVLNGLMSIPADARPALALIPTGSGNDTRRTLGIPTDVTQAALCLATGVTKRFDVGVCNGTYFNNSFAAGLDAKVTAKAVELKVTKRRDGLWLYLSALMHVLFKDLSSFPVTITFDDEPAQTRENLIIAVTNGPTYGGGFFITPNAIADDGVFDVCEIDPMSLAQALWRLPFVVVGKHTRMRPVHMSRHRRVTIECDCELPAQIDGEVLLERRYEVSILPGAIECIVPRSAQ